MSELKNLFDEWGTNPNIKILTKDCNSFNNTQNKLFKHTLEQLTDQHFSK